MLNSQTHFSGTRSTDRALVTTFILCFLASVADGFDLQSTGIASIPMRNEFGMSTAQLSLMFASNSAGMFMGATFGGKLADMIGRRSVMVASMVMFGVFSVATAILTSPSLLPEVRFCTGLGLGAALANVISLVSEVGSLKNRAKRVTLITAGNPLGGVLPGTLLSIWPSFNWRVIFQIGGWWPLILVVAMFLWLPESKAFLQARERRLAAQESEASASFGKALFGEGRSFPTFMLWLSFFFCIVVMYLMVYWLPSLLLGQGYATRDTSIAALTFPLGGTLGTILLGLASGSKSRRPILIFAFGGIVVSMTSLAFAPHNLLIVLAEVFFVGFFAIGSQFLLYGFAPNYYPARVRGTGVGTAVAVGRLGSVAGPALAGYLLSLGLSSAQVLISILPGVAIAFLAALALAQIPNIQE